MIKRFLKKYQRKIIVLLIVAMPLSALFYFVRVPLMLAIMERTLITRMDTTPFYERLPDGLHLGLCGAGSPMPDTARSGPCVAIIAGTQYFIFDAGTNGAHNLIRMGWQPGRIDSVFLTHFHSDHLDGLGALATLRWVGGDHESPLPVYGATGVKEIVGGFNRAYALDAGYRTAHHGEEIARTKSKGLIAKEFKLPKDDKVLVLDKEGVKIYAFVVAHDPIRPALGYRIEYKGRVITLSGNRKKSARVAKFAAGSDLLVHEALSFTLANLITRAAEEAGNARFAKITQDNYHTSPVEAAQIAAQAGVGHLLLYHIVPPLPFGALESVFLKGTREAFSGPITLGKDGLLFSLPAIVKKAEDEYGEEVPPEIITDELL